MTTTFAQVRDRLAKLGYGLERNALDNMKRRWPFHSFPTQSGGPHNYFLSIGQVERYAAQVEQVRSWQEVT